MKKAIVIIAASVMAASCVGGCSNAGYMPGYSDTPQSTRPDEVSYMTGAEETAEGSAFEVGEDGGLVLSPNAKENRVKDRKEGSYRCPKDIPAGIYVCTSYTDDGFNAFASVTDSGTGSIISHDGFSCQTVIQVYEGETLNTGGCTITGLTASKAVDLQGGVVRDGSYLTGLHIPAGRYSVRNSKEDFAYNEVTVYSDASRKGAVATYSKVDDGTEISLSSGVYVQIKDAELIYISE